MAKILQNREAWLTTLATLLRSEVEKAAGTTIPPFRVSMSFPSKGALSRKRRTIGQCWHGMTSKDGSHELFISPVLEDEMEVAATLAHEMLHAAVGVEHGHKKPFADACRRMGLEGKATATVAGQMFKAMCAPLIESIGYRLPHAALVANAKHRPDSTRLLKAKCVECGYTVRTTAKWLVAYGAPICPCNSQQMEHNHGV